MSELWDVYDGNGQKTGRTMERGVPKPGEYMLCVHIYLHTPDGRFLVQKRSKTKESHPGEWDVTGGAVLHGEESIDAAIRETLEEIGISLSKDELHFVSRIKKRKSCADVYFAEKAFELSACTLQEEEVEEVSFVSGEELLKMEKNERLREIPYMEVIERAVRRRGFV